MEPCRPDPQTTSEADLPAGFNTSLVRLVKWKEMEKKVMVEESIKKDEALEVTVETQGGCGQHARAASIGRVLRS